MKGYIAALLLLGGQAAAQDTRSGPLVVATREVAPFAIRNQDDTWSGISVELWEDLAARLGLAYEIREVPRMPELLDAVASGEAQVGGGAITVTPERQERMDFTHPFYSTGLGIAVVTQERSQLLGLVERFVSWEFLQVVAALVFVLAAVALLVWLFERRSNPLFGGRPAEGIGSAFWWSAVTMTTVGYGDKVPVTTRGRLVGLVWMFAAILLISSFTASIASTLTVSRLESNIQGPRDLVGRRVAAVPGTTSARYLAGLGVRATPCETPLVGLRALAAGDVEAVVHDSPVLRYLARKHLRDGVRVLPETFQRQDYAFALPLESGLRRPLNRLLVEKLRTPQWKETLRRYLGR